MISTYANALNRQNELSQFEDDEDGEEEQRIHEEYTQRKAAMKPDEKRVRDENIAQAVKIHESNKKIRQTLQSNVTKRFASALLLLSTQKENGEEEPSVKKHSLICSFNVNSEKISLMVII